MRVFVLFFLAVSLFFSASSSLSAQGILGEISTESVQVEKFDPNHLPSDWWSFFEKQEGIGDTLELVMDRLHEMQKTLPADEQTLAETLISRFLANVSVYAQLRAENVEEKVSGWLPKQSYTIDELIHLNDQVIQQAVDLNIKAEEKKELIDSLTALKGGLSNFIVLYRDMSHPSSEKFMAALKLIVQRSRIAFQEEELRILKGRMKIREASLHHRKEELALAFDRLHLTSDDIVNLVPIKAAMETAQISILLAETEAAKSLADSHRNIGEQKLQQQKVFIAQTQHLILQLDLLEGELINFLVDLSGKKSSSKNLKDMLARWNGELAKVQSQVDYIREKTRFDHELTSRYLANASQDDEGKEEQKILDLMQQRQKDALETMKNLISIDHLIQHVKLLTGYVGKELMQDQTVIENIEFHFTSMLQLWWSKSYSIFNFVIFSIGETPITLSGILAAMAIIAMAVYLSKITAVAIDGLVEAKGASAVTVYTLKRVVHFVIILTSILIALSTLGLTLSSLAIILGALSVGIGFGLQTIVNNFLCGVVLLFERNIKIGDIIELSSGAKGVITEIHVQNTNVHTFDGMDIIVPNSEMITKEMTNWTRKDPYMRLHIPFGIGYECDLQKVRELVSQAAKEHEASICDHKKLSEPDVWLVAFGDNALELELVVWVNVFKATGGMQLKVQYLYMIERILRENKMNIPYAQRDIHIRTLPEELLQELKALRKTEEAANEKTSR